MDQPIPSGIEALYSNPEKENTFQSWLSRLCWTADGQQATLRKNNFFKNIATLLNLASTNAQFREIFELVLDDASKTCGDRVALSLLHLDIVQQLITMDKSDLLSFANFLIRGIFTLSKLEEIARNKIQTLRMFDEIEVYLGYPVMLKEALDIPITTVNMLYFSCSGIEQADLDFAKDLILSDRQNEALTSDFLANNSYWHQALEANYPERMKEIGKKAAEEGIDPIPHYLELTKTALSKSDVYENAIPPEKNSIESPSPRTGEVTPFDVSNRPNI